MNDKIEKKSWIRNFISAVTYDVRTVVRFFRMARTLDRNCFAVLGVTAVIQSLSPFVSVIIPKLIIDELMGQQRMDRFILLVLAASLIGAVLTLAGKKTESLLRSKCLELQEKCRVYLGNRVMYRDYEDLENPEILDNKNKAVLPVLEGGIWSMASCVTYCLSSLITMIGLIAIIATLNYVVILLILLMVTVNIFLYKKSRETQYEAEKKEAVLMREMDYYEGLTGDFSVGKDVRLYAIRGIIMKKIVLFQQKARAFLEGAMKKCAKIDGVTRANAQLQMVFAYIIMTAEVLFNGLSIANFTMYVSAANAFSNGLSTFFNQLIWFVSIVQKVGPFLDFVDIHPKKTDEGESTQGVDTCEIEFRNVSFHYPRGDEKILDDVSITIHAGEKLSVVGLNGAGKTTFIKLLTRLYDPDEGEILVNGVDIRTYGYQEYLKLLAVVFQDFKTLAFTIRENVALEESETADDTRVMDALDRAGLHDDIAALPQGLDTALYKIFDENGIEFSGGQNQKLAIARAIYKNAPVVVLDEPTAALDPLSEYEIYHHFNELIGEKTTIYISHRLSSCRFCDRIVVFADGAIAQCGTHEQLIAQKGGQYERMYSKQAQYYV